MGTESPLKAKEEPVIITINDQEDQRAKQVVEAELQEVKTKVKQQEELLNKTKQSNSNLPVNPDTGLPYTISYEGVNSYEKDDSES
jgi:hypothetical protein